MLHYLPLEKIENRYTAILDTQLQRELKKQKVKYTLIEWENLTTKIDNWAFLDSEWTNYYKFSQLQKVAKMFKEWEIGDWDIFFVSDLWFPWLEAIKYMAYFRGINVKIKWLLHAWSFTETDYVRWMEDWAKYIEMWWFKMVDTIYLWSNFIKSELIEKGRIIDFKKLKVLWLPFIREDYYKIAPYKEWGDKEDIVVFVWRLDDEKQPWIFDRIAKEVQKELPNVKFIKTVKEKLSKKEYLELLSRSKVVFSSALQENFWYGILECATYWLNLVLPNRLVYPEFYWEECIYNNEEQAIQMIKNWLKERNLKSVFYAIKQEYNLENIIKDLWKSF